MSALEVYDVDTFDSTSTPSLIEMIAAVEPLHKRLSPRARRRDEKRRRNRGVRPSDAVEMKTSGWFKRKKKDPQLHPRYGCTRLALVPDEAGDRVPDVQWHFPKPAPNRRRELVPSTLWDEPDDTSAEEVLVAATTNVENSLEEPDIVFEGPTFGDETVAVVFVPTDDGGHTIIEIDDNPDPDVLEALYDDDVPDRWADCALPECVGAMHTQPAGLVA